MGKNRASAGLEMMADIFSPIIPILVIGGTAKAFLSLLAAVGLTDQWEKSWQILKLAADVPDILFPVLLAVSASRKFHGNGLAAAMIGGGAAGCFMGIFWICCYAQVMPGIFALPAYIGPDGRISLYFAITACVIAFAVSFSAAWLLGIEDEETT